MMNLMFLLYVIAINLIKQAEVYIDICDILPVTTVTLLFYCTSRKFYCNFT